MSFSIEEIVRKLLGNIEPCGDSNIDEEKLDNLQEYIMLTEDLIYKLIEAAEYKDRLEWSMSKIGNGAYNFLTSIRDIINENID
jgi:hypothetical protein